MKVIIIGGVAGGASAAARLRRLDEKMEITIYEKTGFISYANCGLPYFVGNVIKDKKNLTLQSPAGFKKRFNVLVNVNHEVTSINPNGKTITVKNLVTNETITDSYDKLIIATGAKTYIPDFVKKNERIFTLRTVEDSYHLKDYIEKNSPQKAVVIGGGFIGVEIAENLQNLGIKTTIIEESNQLLRMVDSDMASFIHPVVRANGVEVLLNSKIKNIEYGKEITLNTYTKQITTDIVILATGIRPNSMLAKEANLELGINEAIVVNEYMQTSNPDIYAVGDVVQTNEYITKSKALIPLAGPANKQGRVAADNICKIKNNYQGSLRSSIIKVFDLTVAQVGLTEAFITEEYEKVIITSQSHASYYPNAKAMTIKVLYSKETKDILGAQIVGYDGVDKQIDILSTAIFAKVKATSLKDLDLAYAPPYSSAKAPVNMVGFVIDNIENGLVKQFHYHDISSLQNQDVILLDTRTPLEYERGHAEGFINIPVDDLRNRLCELDKSKKIYVMCQSAYRSYVATRILVQNGFDAYNYSGGYRLYSSIYNDEVMSKESFPCGMDK